MGSTLLSMLGVENSPRMNTDSIVYFLPILADWPTPCAGTETLSVHPVPVGFRVTHDAMIAVVVNSESKNFNSLPI